MLDRHSNQNVAERILKNQIILYVCGGLLFRKKYVGRFY